MIFNYTGSDVGLTVTSKQVILFCDLVVYDYCKCIDI
jgi:hypothetical protein